MTTRLTTQAQEKGTFVISFSLTDENGQAVVPTTLTWSLTDDQGTAINGKTDQPITPPVSAGDIVLSGDDLALLVASNAYETRVLTLEGAYNSSHGNGLPLKEEIWFKVVNLVAV